MTASIEGGGKLQPAGRWRASVAVGRATSAVLAGLGGFLTIYVLAALTSGTGAVFLIAPFGASCVLVLALPESPLAWPRNVIGGHLISSAIGIAVFAQLGATPLSLALGVGLAIAAMSLTRTLHPPAGADPIVVIMAGASWSFLPAPVLAGSLAVVALAAVYRRLPALLVWARSAAAPPN